MKVDYIQHCGSDLAVVNAARVSFDKESDWEYIFNKKKQQKGYLDVDCMDPVLSSKDKGLTNYLAEHEHFSPFNHTFITVRVKAPIFVARQLVKHEYMPWNEVSRRYVDSPPEFYEPEWRRRPDSSIKQGSGEDMILPPESDGAYSEAVLASLRAYDQLLKDGVAPEQARAVLPQNMYTEWYWSGTLKAFAKMYNLRIDAHAQKETQFIAQECGKIIAPLFPVAWSALTNVNKNK